MAAVAAGVEGGEGGGRTEGEEEGVGTPQQRERSSTGSDSMVSTASRSSEELTTALAASQRKGWVNFDENDSSKPPLPPPRSQLDDVAASGGAIIANPATTEVSGDQFVDFNPLSRTANDDSSGRLPPFGDFGAQVAQSLFSQAKNRNSIDAYTANLMASTSKDIYMALDRSHTIPERRESEPALPEPLIPTSSSASVSSLDRNGITSLPSTNPFAPLPLNPTANGFPSSQGNPLVRREWVKPQGPPPPKPLPYSGKPVAALKPPGSGPDDLFSNLLEGMSMQAYANSVPKCSSPSAASPQHTGHTAVEAPLV